MEGYFISFEGVEGSGKSTLVRTLKELLEKHGYTVCATREPGGSELAERIRSVILNYAMDPLTELFLYEAARSTHLAEVVVPALRRNEIVLCDRFVDSTLAYQGFARGLDTSLIQSLNTVATSGLKPDLTALLLIDPEKGLKRAKDPNRFEKEGVEFQKKVLEGFLSIQKEDPARWLSLDVEEKTPLQLAERVFSEMQLRRRA